MDRYDLRDILVPILMVIFIIAMFCIIFISQLTAQQVGVCHSPCYDKYGSEILGQKCESPQIRNYFGEYECNGYVTYFKVKG